MVNEEYNPIYAQDENTYPDGNIYYPMNGQKVLGKNNIISSEASFVDIIGSNNIVNPNCSYISLVNSSGCIVNGGCNNVSLINSSGVIVEASNYTAIRNAPINEENIVISLNRTLTAAELATGYSLPIEVIPAPGAGKVIEIISGFAKLRFNSVPYDTAFIVLTNGSPQYPMLVAGIDITANFFPQESVDTLSKFQSSEGFYIGSIITGGMIENTAVYAAFAVGDPTTGDSEIDIYISYRIVTL